MELTSLLRNALLDVRTDLERIVRDGLRAELGRWSAGDPDELLPADRAASYLGMSPAALRRAAERGTAPVAPVRLGRRLRWRRGDLLMVARSGTEHARPGIEARVTTARADRKGRETTAPQQPSK
jgi:hypothetical protein